MAKRSAGLLLYKRDGGGLKLLLVHPGGPFWAKKDAGAWSIPKGEYAQGAAEDAARREFAEELGDAGAALARGAPLLPLGEVRQKSGKVVTGFALEGELDVAQVRSNLCEIEWPPRSGRRLRIPEIDRAQWFTPSEARRKILPGQAPLIERLLALLGGA